MSTLAVGATIGILASFLMYSFIAIRSSDADENRYFFYNWSLGSSAVAATIFASGMSLSTVVIALLGLGAVFGIALCWAMVAYCIGWLVIAALSSRIKEIVDRDATIHSFLGARYQSRSLTVVASTTTIIGFLGTFATELMAGEAICLALGFEPALARWGMIVLGVGTILYSSFGGFTAVINSDRLQTWLFWPTMIAIIWLCYYFWFSHGAPPLSENQHFRQLWLPSHVALSIALINIAFPIVDMSAWQRLLASSSAKKFRHGALYAVLGFSITWTALIIAAVLITPAIPNDGSSAFEAIFSQFVDMDGILPFVIGFFVFPGLVAAMVSTADTFLNSATVGFASDLSRKFTRIDATRAGLLMGTGGFVIAVVLKYIGFGIVEMVFAVYGGTLSLFPSVISALIYRRRENLSFLKVPAIVSIVTGFVMGWMNGIYSVSEPIRNSLDSIGADVIFRNDVYQSPTYSFFSSVIVFVLAIGLGHIRRRLG